MSDIDALWTVIAECAGSRDLAVEVISVIAVDMQVLVLINPQIEVVSRLGALSRVSTGIANHDSLEVHFQQ